MYDLAQEAYDLYKQDWEASHITVLEKERAIAEWEALVESDLDAWETYPEFEDWLEDNGYSGKLYASMREFLETEFEDACYMHELLAEEPELLAQWERR
jgi:hypothetical protein